MTINVRCSSCERTFTIINHQGGLVIQRYCPVCGERMLSEVKLETLKDITISEDEQK